ncbi:hypothetical protein DIPPA_64169 [Diplonema papillatum]|nr:hypothetical protein DIPPA_64169 [Diplonema papillatum]
MPPPLAGSEDELQHLLPHGRLVATPSGGDGVSADDEWEQRAYGCDVIRDASVLLSCSAAVSGRARVLFHRYYFNESLRNADVHLTAVACLSLALTLEDCQTLIKDLLAVFHRVLARRSQTEAVPPSLDFSSELYAEYRDAVILAEKTTLRTLGYQLATPRPLSHVVLFCEIIGPAFGGKKKDVAQTAWAIACDSFRLTVHCRFTSNVLAATCLYLAARQHDIPLPDDWWHIFDVQTVDLIEAAKSISSMYTETVPPRYKDLGARKQLPKALRSVLR